MKEWNQLRELGLTPREDQIEGCGGKKNSNWKLAKFERLTHPPDV